MQPLSRDSTTRTTSKWQILCTKEFIFLKPSTWSVECLQSRTHPDPNINFNRSRSPFIQLLSSTVGCRLAKLIATSNLTAPDGLMFGGLFWKTDALSPYIHSFNIWSNRFHRESINIVLLALSVNELYSVDTCETALRLVTSWLHLQTDSPSLDL